MPVDPILAFVRASLLADTQWLMSTSADWACYEGLKSMFIPGYVPSTNTSLDPPKQASQETPTMSLALRYAGCSAIAISTSAIVTNPLEVVRTRWQTSTSRLGSVDRPTVGSIARQIWQSAGWRGFWRGSGARVIYYVSGLSSS